MKYKNYILLGVILFVIILLIVLSTSRRSVSDEIVSEADTGVLSEQENAEVSEETATTSENQTSKPVETSPAQHPATTPTTYVPPKTTAPTPTPGTVTPQVTLPSASPQLTPLESALSGNGSQRCVWIDRNSGANKIALIKDGSIRVQTEENSGGVFFTLYNSIATYSWKDGEKTGVLILDDTDPIAKKVLYDTRSELIDFLVESNRVQCQSATLNDAHFLAPKTVSFTRLDA